MDSINRNQAEQNHEDLAGVEALEKVREIVKKVDTCFFSTFPKTNGLPHARPMAVQEIDAEGNLWFLSPSDSHKNEEVALDGDVQLYFQGSEHSDFLQLSGRATISRDRARIKELWKPMLKTWFTQGVDDPRITVIKVKPTDGYYWDTKHGNMIAGIKMLIGAAVGKTLDDSIEGRIALG